MGSMLKQECKLSLYVSLVICNTPAWKLSLIWERIAISLQDTATYLYKVPFSCTINSLVFNRNVYALLVTLVFLSLLSRHLLPPYFGKDLHWLWSCTVDQSFSLHQEATECQIDLHVDLQLAVLFSLIIVCQYLDYWKQFLD